MKCAWCLGTGYVGLPEDGSAVFCVVCEGTGERVPGPPPIVCERCEVKWTLNRSMCNRCMAETEDKNE